MNTAYNMLENFIPVRNALKVREDGNFLIAANHEKEIFYLNSTAREFWEFIDGNINIDSICEKFLCEYDINRESLENDLVNLLRDLQWKKLIRLKTGGDLS